VGAKIVLFGATGYTGRLVAEALISRGARPVLSGRNAARLAELRAELGVELEVHTAQVEDPGSIADLIDVGDVLVTTVGPFVRFGPPAAVAAVAKRATYLDSTGEAAFLRDLQTRLGSKAAAAGCALIPAFGYDYVPGNLAGALALQRAGDRARRLDIGYFAPGSPGMSGGTAASGIGMMLMPSYRFHAGRLSADRLGARTRTFSVNDRGLIAVAIGGSEHLFLPPLAPQLGEVGVYLGWFGKIGRFAPAGSAIARAIAAIPGATGLFSSAGATLRGSTGGPDARARGRGSMLVVAEAADESGRTVARVELTGPEPYTLTGRLLAWAATTALAGGVRTAGVVGPVQAFSLDQLATACAELGLVEQQRITNPSDPQ
jgi:short subunit dehydrogenase-like uncharacterized protein